MADEKMAGAIFLEIEKGDEWYLFNPNSDYYYTQIPFLRFDKSFYRKGFKMKKGEFLKLKKILVRERIPILILRKKSYGGNFYYYLFIPAEKEKISPEKFLDKFKEIKCNEEETIFTNLDLESFNPKILSYIDDSERIRSGIIFDHKTLRIKEMKFILEKEEKRLISLLNKEGFFLSRIFIAPLSKNARIQYKFDRKVKENIPYHRAISLFDNLKSLLGENNVYIGMERKGESIETRIGMKNLPGVFVKHYHLFGPINKYHSSPSSIKIHYKGEMPKEARDFVRTLRFYFYLKEAIEDPEFLKLLPTMREHLEEGLSFYKVLKDI